jgi:hypothetical protein
LRARCLGDVTVLHAGGASAFTSPAQQAQIKVVFESFTEIDSTFGCSFDQMNPAARRLRFQLQRSIGWTLIQTKAAVNALVELGEVECGDPFFLAAALRMAVGIQGIATPGVSSFQFPVPG